jgi:hypothetical protein
MSMIGVPALIQRKIVKLRMMSTMLKSISKKFCGVR